jgi:threonine synthase
MLTCVDCSQTHAAERPVWRCTCGGRLLLEADRPFDPAIVNGRPGNLWRYQEHYHLSPDSQAITLGEGGTPLIETTFTGLSVHAKLDFRRSMGETSKVEWRPGQLGSSQAIIV